MQVFIINSIIFVYLDYKNNLIFKIKLRVMVNNNQQEIYLKLFKMYTVVMMILSNNLVMLPQEYLDLVGLG